MNYIISIQSEAEHDLDDAFIWYELNQAGLGKRFFESVDESVCLLTKNPLAFAEFYGGLRRALIKKFPYGIYYKVILERKEIQIVGILYFGRDLKILRYRV
jgi:hypothetical protein